MAASGGSPGVLLCNSCNTIISDTLELRGEAVELSAYVLNGNVPLLSCSKALVYCWCRPVCVLECPISREGALHVSSSPPLSSAQALTMQQ
jgi:hypothetical protein